MIRQWLACFGAGRLVVGLAAMATIGLAISLTASPASALDKAQCLQCHGGEGMTRAGGDGEVISLHVDSAALDKSVHKFVDCTQCHTTPHTGKSPLTKLSLADSCGQCHKYERELHALSAHGQQLAQGNREVATCVDCHSTDGTPHSILPTLSFESPAYRKNVADTCLKCHGNEELMTNYGIVEKVYESYMRSFHGKAMLLETDDIRKLNVATCTNCHGTHNIMKTNDPGSPVASLSNLTATCEQCHRGAGENFAAGFLGHREASPRNSPVVFYAEQFFKFFTSSVVIGGAGLVTLAIIRSTRKKHHKDE